MKNKTRKTAIITVMALLFVTQLVFIKSQTSDKSVNNNFLLDNNGSINYTGEANADNSYTEEVVSAELNVVYRNNVTSKDISEEMEENRTHSDYDNKIVSYTMEELPIYEEPDAKSALMGIMYSGSEGDILEKGTEWTRIVSGEVTGYIRNVDVLFGKEAEVVASIIGTKSAVAATDISVYADADDKSETVSTLSEGAQISAYEENGGYTLILCDNGFGYVKSSCINVSYGLNTAKSKAELDAIEAERRAEEARKAAELAAQQAEQAKKEAADKAVSQNTVTRDQYNVSEDDVHLLAAIVYWESGWEPAEGQLAVANVVLNRVSSTRFSQNSISAVIYAPGQFTGVAENGQPSQRFQSILNMSNEELNIRGCYDTAIKALSGVNNIGDMLFFVNVRKADFAKYTGYTIINNHCFYTY